MNYPECSVLLMTPSPTSLCIKSASPVVDGLCLSVALVPHLLLACLCLSLSFSYDFGLFAVLDFSNHKSSNVCCYSALILFNLALEAYTFQAVV